MTKNLAWRLCLMAAFGWLAFFCRTPMVVAAEEEPSVPRERLQRQERLERLEQRLNELAQRQEQLMRRLGAAPEHLGPMPPPGPEGLGGPLPPVVPLRPLAAKLLQDIGGLVKLGLLACILFNVLLAIWIYTDIRKRGEGSGIFIALALVAGIPAAIIYALVRIGDKKA